jgi:hypothetical protein
MAYIPPQWREGLCHEIKNQTRGRPKIGSLTSLACPSASSGRCVMPSTRRRNTDQHRRRRRRNGPHRRAAFTRGRRGANQKAARGGAFRSDLRSCPTPTLVPRSPTESQGSWPSLRGRAISQPDPDSLVPIESAAAVPCGIM